MVWCGVIWCCAWYGRGCRGAEPAEASLLVPVGFNVREVVAAAIATHLSTSARPWLIVRILWRLSRLRRGHVDLSNVCSCIFAGALCVPMCGCGVCDCLGCSRLLNPCSRRATLNYWHAVGVFSPPNPVAAPLPRLHACAVSCLFRYSCKQVAPGDRAVNAWKTVLVKYPTLRALYIRTFRAFARLRCRAVLRRTVPATCLPFLSPSCLPVCMCPSDQRPPPLFFWIPRSRHTHGHVAAPRH